MTSPDLYRDLFPPPELIRVDGSYRRNPAALAHHAARAAARRAAFSTGYRIAAGDCDIRRAYDAGLQAWSGGIAA